MKMGNHFGTSSRMAAHVDLFVSIQQLSFPAHAVLEWVRLSYPHNTTLHKKKQKNIASAAPPSLRYRCLCSHNMQKSQESWMLKILIYSKRHTNEFQDWADLPGVFPLHHSICPAHKHTQGFLGGLMQYFFISFKCSTGLQWSEDWCSPHRI